MISFTIFSGASGWRFVFSFFGALDGGNRRFVSGDDQELKGTGLEGGELRIHGLQLF